MKKLIGLWIDRKRALILTLEEKKEQLKQIQSNLETYTHFEGDTHAKYFKAEDQMDRHLGEHMKKYYREIITSVRDAAAILIMGPGEAKFEFEKRLSHERVKARVAMVETADKLTERQFTARVRKYFKN